MENQHRHIKGYRELDAGEIQVMNDLKAHEADALRLIESQLKSNPDFDQRWVAIGRTHLEQAFMALVRAVARPAPPA